MSDTPITDQAHEVAMSLVVGDDFSGAYEEMRDCAGALEQERNAVLADLRKCEQQLIAVTPVTHTSHDWEPDGGVLRFESHPNGEAPHVHTTCAKCGARAWFLQYQWELLAKGCDVATSSTRNAK